MEAENAGILLLFFFLREALRNNPNKSILRISLGLKVFRPNRIFMVKDLREFKVFE